jgi:pimeloyl-ACP methyl ester carboxylesterase
MFARGALTLDTRNGPFAAWDFGGDGPDVLLVHGTGHLPTELWDLFRYRWVASPDEVDAYVQEVCLAAANDWLNAGIDVSVVAAFTRRSFLKDGASYVRRPTMEEIAMVSVPDSRAEIYPSVDLYSRIAVPLGLVLAEKGLYGHREKDVMAIVGNHPDRHFIKLESGHNVHMQKPEEIARFITRNFL